MQEIRTLIIMNPMAGRRKARRAARVLMRVLNESGQTAQVYTTAGKGDATRIVRQMADKVDRIICCGGDGTLNEVLCGVMESNSKVVVGYVPSGTTNDLATSLRMPTQIDRAVNVAVYGETHQHDIGIFNGDRFFDYVASFGAFTKTAYTTPQKLKNMLGHLAYLLFGIQYAFQIRPFHADIETEGKVISGDFLFGSVSNATRLAGIIDLPKEMVRFDDGKFEVVLIRQPRPDEILRTRGKRREKGKPQYIYLFSTDKITFHFSEEVEWTLDGEDGGRQKDVVILNKPRAVDLVSSFERAGK
ncbi:MAG: YegS/Rv2252/BmrU family lipid kinase [Clostridia bacterium]|nr:YegS/Rv2252/BmrU family lipid kinase [Clostridia bacterium]